MTKLPRRRIEPLEPAPDSFDRVLTSARRRRRRRALVVASATLTVALVAAGSFALGSSLNVTQRLDNASHGGGDGIDSPTTTVQASPARTNGHRKQAKKAPASETEPARNPPISWLRGRAVDPEGNGIAGLYVLPGTPGRTAFSPSGTVAARTDRNGDYTIACPRAPVLLATWALNQNLPAVSTGGNWAATFVGGTGTTATVPDCGNARYTTTLGSGASLHGTVTAQGDCAPGATFPVWVWLNGDRGETVRLAGLRAGDTFSFAGLPAGTHTLGTGGVRVPITFGSGSSQDHDASFSCSNGVATGIPVDSPSPDSTGDPTDPVETGPPATPSPTPSPTFS
jgi:hypothetical protein